MDRNTNDSHRIPIVFAGLGVAVSLGGLLMTTSWDPAHSVVQHDGASGVLPDEVERRSPTRHAEVSGESALDGLAADDATSEYLEIVHEGRSSVETVAYLVEWLRANPDGTTDLVDLLRARAVDGDRSGWAGLMSALHDARTPQSSDALVAIHADLDIMVVTNTAVHARSMLDRSSEAEVLATTAPRSRW